MNEIFKKYNKISDLKNEILENFYIFVHFMNIRKENKILIPKNGLYKNLCYNLQNSESDTMILLPRRHLKTLIASLYVTWYVIKHPNKSVLIMTDTRRKGIKLLNGIKSFFMRHDAFKFLFPEHSLSYKGNNEDTLTLNSRTTYAKEPNVAVYGILQPIQSARADFILLEDIVSDEFVRSEANREMVRYNLESLNAILEKDSKKVVTGTRYTIDDPYQDIIDENDQFGGWNIIQEGVYKEDGTALCEEVMSLEEIKTIQRKHSKFYFSSQYLNDPITNDINIFELDKFGYYEQIPTYDYVVMGVDLSDGIGKDSNALSIIGYKNDTYYLLDCYANNRIDAETFYFKIRYYFEKYPRVLKVIVEANRSGRSILRDTFLRLDQNFNSKIPFEGIYNSEPKNVRIHKLLPLLNSQKLLLRKTSDNFSKLESEFLHFSYLDKNNKDDLLDSVTFSINYLERVNTVKNKDHKGFKIYGRL